MVAIIVLRHCDTGVTDRFLVYCVREPIDYKSLILLIKNGGAEGNRTPDLDVANVALSQLSYGPVIGIAPAGPERGG